jgi:hypothetical protein
MVVEELEGGEQLLGCTIFVSAPLGCTIVGHPFGFTIWFVLEGAFKRDCCCCCFCCKPPKAARGPLLVEGRKFVKALL